MSDIWVKDDAEYMASQRKRRVEGCAVAKGGLAEVLAERGGVPHLKMLVLSRTGRHANGSNKVRDGETESALLVEARAAVAGSPRSKCPPAPSGEVEEHADGADEGEDSAESAD